MNIAAEAKAEHTTIPGVQDAHNAGRINRQQATPKIDPAISSSKEVQSSANLVQIGAEKTGTLGGNVAENTPNSRKTMTVSGATESHGPSFAAPKMPSNQDGKIVPVLARPNMELVDAPLQPTQIAKIAVTGPHSVPARAQESAIDHAPRGPTLPLPSARIGEPSENAEAGRRVEFQTPNATDHSNRYHLPAPQTGELLTSTPSPQTPTPSVAAEVQPGQLPGTPDDTSMSVKEYSMPSGFGQTSHTQVAHTGTSQPLQIQTPPATQPTQIPEFVIKAASQLSTERPIEITLQPEELGRLRMVLQPSEASMTVSISAERAETLEILRRHIDQLTSQLKDLGYTNLDLNFEWQRDPHDRQQETSEDSFEGPGDLQDNSSLTSADQPSARTHSNGRLDIRV